MTQLAELSRPFSGKYVQQKPGSHGAVYVEHSDVTQRLLQVVGPFSQTVVQIVRGDVPAKVDRKTGEVEKPALTGAVTGVVLALTFTVDGREVSVQEVGEVEHPHNHTTDGSRLKHATSDAFKRCAMRAGLGLHLWCGDHYFLSKALNDEEADGE